MRFKGAVTQSPGSGEPGCIQAILGFSLRSGRVSARESCVRSQAMAAIPEAGKAPQGGWPRDQLSPSKLAVPFAVGSGQGQGRGESRRSASRVYFHVCAIRILRCGWRVESRQVGVSVSHVKRETPKICRTAFGQRGWQAPWMGSLGWIQGGGHLVLIERHVQPRRA